MVNIKEEIKMNRTELTPQVLMNNGFEQRNWFGHLAFVKGKCAVVYSFHWMPCNAESGVLLSSNTYVTTWEELEKLMQEGGAK